MDACYPLLLLGDDLRNHIIAQRESRKVKTGLCERYCLHYVNLFLVFLRKTAFATVPKRQMQITSICPVAMKPKPAPRRPAPGINQAKRSLALMPSATPQQ